MSKTETVKNYIAVNYQGRCLRSKFVTRLAIECEVSPSTVYKAIRQLRSIGAIQGTIYTGRQFVHPDELGVVAKGSTLLLSDAKITELAHRFFATNAAIRNGVMYGVRSGRMIPLNGGRYGYLVRVK